MSDKQSDEENGQEEELSEEEQSQVTSDPPPTILEWTVRAASLVLVVGLIGYLMVTGLQAADPPLFSFEVGTVEASGNAWRVPVVMTNDGDVGVSVVEVTLEVLAGGEIVDSESITLPLLGAGGSAEIEFWVDEDPTTNTIRFDVGSYAAP